MSSFRNRFVLIAVALVTAVAFARFDSPLGIVAVPLVALVALLALGVSSFSTYGPAGRSGKRGAYEQLLERARGNKELVDRLIEHERQRTPGADGAVLAQNALSRWVQDDR